MSDTGDAGVRTIERDRWRVLPGWGVLVAAAVAFWGVGFLPWIAEGMHLQDSTVWARRFDTIEGPVVALPFSEFAFWPILVSSVIGGTVALAGSRFAAPGVLHPRRLAGAGVLVALGAALVQTAWTVWPSVAQTSEARSLVVALVATALASGALGILVGAGVARGNGWPWLLGGATAASLSGSWLVDLIARNPALEPEWLLGLAQWHPLVSAISLGLVLAVFGLRPATQMVGWVVGLAIAWVAPVVLAMLLLVTYAFARRGSWGDDNVVGSVVREYSSWLLPSQLNIWPAVGALVIGMVGTAWLRSRQSDRSVEHVGVSRS